MSAMKLYLELTVTDTKTGKIVRKIRRKLSRSYVLQWLKWVQALMEHPFGADGTVVAAIDTGNVSRNLQSTTDQRRQFGAINAPVNVSTYGLVVGSNLTAPTNADYTLGAQIAHGVGAGQLQYGAHAFINPAVVGSNVDYVIQRPFINGSGGDVTVRECGLYITGYDTGGVQRFFLGIRDVFADVVVANGQTLTVTYTLRTTV